MIRGLMLLACVASGSASAQNADGLFYSHDATEICLANSETMSEKSECIGRSANLCMDETPGGYSTFAMGGCISLETAFWDARLNAVYKSVQAAAAAQDADAMQGAPSQTEALRAMQRAWIPYRDATCSYEAAQWGGGTGAGPAFGGCLMRMTGEQSLYLELGGLGG